MRSTHGLRLGRGLGFTALLGVCIGAQAEAVQVRLSMSTGFTALHTRSGTAQAQNMAVVTAGPALSMNSQGASHRITAALGTEAIYNSGDEAGGVRALRPRGSVEAQLAPIPRVLELTAAARADRSGLNPFAPRPDTDASANASTAIRYLVRPQFTQVLTPTMALLARSEHVWTHVQAASGAADPASRTRAVEQTVRLEHRPTPVGWSIEAGREVSRIAGATQDTINLAFLRAVGTYAVSDQLTLGTSIGREAAQYSQVDRTDGILGLRMRWQPTERSSVRMGVEKRFFGTAVELETTHRSPFLNLNFRAHRQPVVQAGRFLTDPSSGSITASLDNILTTRYPDPTARALAVHNIVTSLGSQVELASGLELNARHAQLHEGLSGTAVYLGKLSLASLSLYLQRQTRLERAEDLLGQGGLGGDVRHVGFDLRLARQVLPGTALQAGLRLGHINGLNENAGAWSREWAARLGMSHTLSPNSSVVLLLRRQLLDSNAVVPTSETALSAFLSQRF